MIYAIYWLIIPIVHCAIAVFITKLRGAKTAHILWISPLISFPAAVIFVSYMITHTYLGLAIFVMLLFYLPGHIIVTFIFSSITLLFSFVAKKIFVAVKKSDSQDTKLKSKTVNLLVLFALIAILISLFMVMIFSERANRPEPVTVDYVEIHGDFLNYSLGEFRVIREFDGWDRGVEYRRWLLGYTRNDGEMRSFSFDNFSSFGFGITLEAQDIGGEAIVDAIGEFLNLDEYRVSRLYAHNRMRFETQGYGDDGISVLDIKFWPNSTSGEFYNRITHPQTGIQLYSVTPAELVADWDFFIDISAESLDIENRNYVVEKLDAITRALSETLQQDRIAVWFELRNHYFDFGYGNRGNRVTIDGFEDDDLIELRYDWIYCRQTDTFETRAVRDRGNLLIPLEEYQNLEIRIER